MKTQAGVKAAKRPDGSGVAKKTESLGGPGGGRPNANKPTKGEGQRVTRSTSKSEVDKNLQRSKKRPADVRRSDDSKEVKTKLKSDSDSKLRKDSNENVRPPAAISTSSQNVQSLPTETENQETRGDIKPLMDISIPPKCPDQGLDAQSKFISRSTGLTALMVSHNVPGHLVSIEERSLLMKLLPNVVLMNSAGKNDSLLIGLDSRPEMVQELIPNLQEKEFKDWSFSFEDVSALDPFSFFSTWNIIPKVDKQGVYSLIVNLRMRGAQGAGKNKQLETEERRNLLDVLKNFNLLKIIHGEGETMIQVGHVLEFIAFSDCIRKQFAIERKHTWHIKPTGQKSEAMDGGNKIFWIKVNCPQMNELSLAHKQYSVNLQLKNVGKVIQLEHCLFGIEDNYLAVFDGKEKVDISKLGAKFNALELTGNSLPDSMIPTYGVDDFGFYTVSGTFPANIGLELRDKFAADMKVAGAVGFRTLANENEFSLHFVNSSSLEKVNKLTKYSSFNLKINSSLIKKASLEKKIKKLVPAILKIKEANKSSSEPKTVKKVTIVEEKIVDKSSDVEKKSPPSQPKENKLVEDTKVQAKKMEIAENLPLKVPDAKSGVQPCAKKVESSNQPKYGLKDKNDAGISLNLSDLLKVNWMQGKGVAGFSKTLGKFLAAFGDTEVRMNDLSNDVEFVFKDKKSFSKQLKFYSRNETNTKDKLKALSTQRISFVGSKFKAFKNLYGLAVAKKKMKDSQEALKKHLAEFPSVEIEDRAGVFIAWFDSKLDYFRVLVSKQLNVGFSLCLANFEEASVTKVNPVSGESSKQKETEEAVPLGSRTEPLDNPNFKLTEKQVFDFVWGKTFADTSIRAVQVISRKLTDFIKEAKISSIVNDDEDGLVFNFKSKKDYEDILRKYCKDALENAEILDGMARKFTLVSNRGNFGIFSAKRLRYEDTKKFGKCKIYNASMWFENKMDMVQVLRDPVLQKLYPLYIDCRNIFILRPSSSQSEASPRFYKTFRPSPNYPMARYGGFSSPRSRFFNDPSSRIAPAFLPVLNKLFPHRPNHRFFNGTSGNPRLNSDYFNYSFTHGKFGVIPSSRMVRSGFKLFKVPLKDPKDFNESDLFLEDKEIFRNKNVKDAAIEVKNILAGTEETQGTLKDLKMKRVELFLREKLGVDNFQMKGNQGPNIFVNLVEGNLNRFEEVAESEAKDALTPDLLGFYTLSLPYTEETEQDLISKLKEDISWFDEPVSILPAVDPSSGNKILEVKMKDEEVTIAAFRGLKHKYPELEVDKTGAHVDIIPDKETGLFTLMFLDKNEKKYAGTVAVFKQYCTASKAGLYITKGNGQDEVLVAFKMKNDAIKALKENLNNPDFPELHVAPSSRS